MRTFFTKRITLKGFIIFDDYGSRYGEFFAQMSQWLNKATSSFAKTSWRALNRHHRPYVGLLNGHNFGKLIVRLG